MVQRTQHAAETMPLQARSFAAVPREAGSAERGDPLVHGGTRNPAEGSSRQLAQRFWMVTPKKPDEAVPMAFQELTRVPARVMVVISGASALALA